MQTVKILGIQGSRKLKTYRSKNRVCLLCNAGGRSTNLEVYIQNEYMDKVSIIVNFGKICISETWRTISAVYTIVSGVWKQGNLWKINVSENWRNV